MTPLMTRIAPTPSGYLHLGNIFSFVLTGALAGRTGAEILLRIDDLDRARLRTDYVTDIFDSLNFLGICWDAGPRNLEEWDTRFSQVLRMPLYAQYLSRLLAAGIVYACSCSRSELAEGRQRLTACGCRLKHIPPDAKDCALRLRTDERRLTMKTPDGRVLHGSVPPEMRDFVVRRKDGFPAYQLCSVVDDLHFGVNLIVRGSDLYASSWAQLYLASVLKEEAFAEAFFVHHPLLTDASGAKLAKSAGSASVRYLREQGLTPPEIFGKIAGLLGEEGQPVNWKVLAELITTDMHSGEV